MKKKKKSKKSKKKLKKKDFEDTEAYDSEDSENDEEVGDDYDLKDGFLVDAPEEDLLADELSRKKRCLARSVTSDIGGCVEHGGNGNKNVSNYARGLWYVDMRKT